MNPQEKLYLVLVEADKIQSYIFQTGKLTENIGASAFIDDYNKEGAYQCLHDTKWNGNIEKDENGFRLAEDKSIISDNLDYELIYSGGGNVKIILQSYDKAKKIAKELVRLYRENTVSADATWVIHEFNPNLRFDLIMREAEMQMRARKLSKGMAVQPRTIPHLKLCQSCGKDAAVELFKERDQEEYLCQSCIAKRQKGKEKGIFDSFFSRLSKNIDPLLSSANVSDLYELLPREFDHLADPRNFIAIVVIDGNRFGKRIQKLIGDICDQNGKLRESTAKLREFSSSVDKLAEESLAEAVDDMFKRDFYSLSGEALQKRFIKRGQFFIPFRPIIIGGDDLTFVCAADWAFSIALNVARILRQKSSQEKELFGENGLSCSIGIAIVKRHFPFRTAHHLAEELLAKAKQKNREYLNSNDFSAIDFSVVTTSSVDELDSRREREFLYLNGNGEKYCLTGRPYLIAEDEERIDEFFTLIKKANKLRSYLAANKFKALRQVLRTGKTNSEYKWLEMVSRLIKEKRRSLKDIEEFYGGLWRKGTYAHKDVLINNFIDMVEIYEYLGNLREGGEWIK
jgi:GGDEF domain-containing protein